MTASPENNQQGHVANGISCLSALISAIFATISVAAALWIHYDQLAVAKKTVELQRDQFATTQAWRTRPLVLFEVGDRDRPTLKNFGQAPALCVTISFDGVFFRQLDAPIHLLPEQTKKLQVMKIARDGEHIRGVVTVSCTDTSGREHTVNQRYLCDRTEGDSGRWEFAKFETPDVSE